MIVQKFFLYDYASNLRSRINILSRSFYIKILSSLT